MNSQCRTGFPGLSNTGIKAFDYKLRAAFIDRGADRIGHETMTASSWGKHPVQDRVRNMTNGTSARRQGVHFSENPNAAHFGGTPLPTRSCRVASQCMRFTLDPYLWICYVPLVGAEIRASSDS
jgi:hypothetical protein